MTGVWQAVLYLHLLAMAFFVGGQLLLAAAVVPVERANPDRERMRAIARRFGYGTLVALAILLATGITMASHLSLWDSTTLQIKLGLVARCSCSRPCTCVIRARTRCRAIFLASLAIVWLGLDLAN